MTSPEPLRLLLVDDHNVVRAGLRRVLEAQDDWTVVAEAADLDRALRATLGHKPDVVILDLNLRGTSSLEAIPDFLAPSPRSRIVVLTMQAEPAFARAALRDGASAYVLKEAAEDELVTAVRSAVAGHTYLTPQMGVLVATTRATTTRATCSPRARRRSSASSRSGTRTPRSPGSSISRAGRSRPTGRTSSASSTSPRARSSRATRSTTASSPSEPSTATEEPAMRADTTPHPIVVVGYDGSPAGRAAVSLGIERVGGTGRLIVVHSHGVPPDYVGVPFYQEMLDQSTDRAAGVMEELEAALPQLRAVDYEPDVVIGPAPDAICRVAEVREADEIIVGTRGLGRMRALLGSVAHEVLHRAGCPVTVIPERMVAAESHDAAEVLAAS